MTKRTAPRNRTLTLSEEDCRRLQPRLVTLNRPCRLGEILGRTIHQDVMEVFDLLPEKCVDLLIADPPYNRRKTFHTITFHASEEERYRNWLEGWVSKLPRILRPAATVYVCCDWQCSQTVYTVLSRYFRMRNRITWEREKGRGAHSNWKNAHEDIWFATMSDKYTFNLDAVKVKRKVLAPYRVEGQPKDWSEETSGNYRTTHPSNLWTDVTVPFWSMQENTDHPTQKPEKLIAKLILASSNEGDVVFDPFSGSGTTSVTAKKLNRCFFSVERDGMYCLLAEKRLELAGRNPAIQGYEDGVFWERNTTPHRKKEE